MTRYYPYKKTAHDPDMKRGMIQIVHDLEKYGRCFIKNGQAARRFAYRVKTAKDQGYVMFTWKPKHKRSPVNISVITLKPGTVLKKTGTNQIDISYSKPNQLPIYQSYKEKTYKDYRKFYPQ